MPRCEEGSSGGQFLDFPCAECSPENRRYVLIYKLRDQKDENKVSRLGFGFSRKVQLLCRNVIGATVCLLVWPRYCSPSFVSYFQPFSVFTPEEPCELTPGECGYVRMGGDTPRGPLGNELLIFAPSVSRLCLSKTVS